MIRAVQLDARRLIQPLFVRPGNKIRQEIGAMPGQYQFSVDELVREAEALAGAGVGGVILFGIPNEKDRARPRCVQRVGHRAAGRAGTEAGYA